jgi:hypothetical protein
MVYLALNRESALQMLTLAKSTGDAVWIGSDAISEAEYQQFGSEGVKLSRFIYPLTSVETTVVSEALETIELHHPGEFIWVQHVSKP